MNELRDEAIALHIARFEHALHDASVSHQRGRPQGGKG
jgi:hypothetical protein